MTLDATASLLNFKKSLDKHVEAALSGHDVVVDWEGGSVEPGEARTIVQPRTRLMSQSSMGQGPEAPAAEAAWQLALNIFVRSGPDAGRLAALRDLLAAAFPPGGRAALYDFAQQPPTVVEWLVFSGHAADQGVSGAPAGWLQHNLTITGRLAQHWTL